MKSHKEIRSVNYEENGIRRITFSHKANAECFPAHWHERLEILYIRSGEMQVCVDDTLYNAAPGYAVIISPMSDHSGVAGNNGVDYDVITFDISKFTNNSGASHKYLTSLAKEKLTFFPLTNHPDITNAIQTLLTYLDEGNSKNPLCAIGKLYEVIGLIYDHCLADTSPFESKPEAFVDIVAYIDNHYTENLTSEGISKMFGYNNTYFCKKFKSVTGMTVMNYVKHLRLSKAKKLLATTNDSIADIAWKCGFFDIAHLSNSFKQHNNMTPSEYRKKKKV